MLQCIKILNSSPFDTGKPCSTVTTFPGQPNIMNRRQSSRASMLQSKPFHLFSEKDYKKYLLRNLFLHFFLEKSIRLFPVQFPILQGKGQNRPPHIMQAVAVLAAVKIQDGRYLISGKEHVIRREILVSDPRFHAVKKISGKLFQNSPLPLQRTDEFRENFRGIFIF